MKRQLDNNVKENIIMMRTEEFEKIYKDIREEISDLKVEVGMLEILWPNETDEISDDFYMRQLLLAVVRSLWVQHFTLLLQPQLT